MHKRTVEHYTSHISLFTVSPLCLAIVLNLVPSMSYRRLISNHHSTIHMHIHTLVCSGKTLSHNAGTDIEKRKQTVWFEKNLYRTLQASH